MALQEKGLFRLVLALTWKAHAYTRALGLSSTGVGGFSAAPGCSALRAHTASPASGCYSACAPLLAPKPCNVWVPCSQHQATSPTTLGKVTWLNVSMRHRSVHSFLLYLIELISCKFKREGFSQIPPAPHHSDSFVCMAMSAGKRCSFQPWQNGEWDGLFHRILVEANTHLLFPYTSEFS